MMASSLPEYCPTRTVILEVPISTAPMKVWLELTLVQMNLIRKGWRGRSGGAGRLRTVPGAGRGRRIGRRPDRDRNLSPEREIDLPERLVRAGPGQVEKQVELGQLPEIIVLGGE